MLRLLASIGLVLGMALVPSGVSYANEAPAVVTIASVTAESNQPPPNCSGNAARPQVPSFYVGVTILDRQPAISPSGKPGVAVTVQFCPSYRNTLPSTYLINKSFVGNSVTPDDLLFEERRPVPVAIPPEGIVMSFNLEADGASPDAIPGVSVVIFDGASNRPIGADFSPR